MIPAYGTEELVCVTGIVGATATRIAVMNSRYEHLRNPMVQNLGGDISYRSP